MVGFDGSGEYGVCLYVVEGGGVMGWWEVVC